MNEEQKYLIQKWLASKDEFRKRAVKDASCLLLEGYLKRWGHFIPVELHRLASTLRAEIIRMSNIEGDAALLPTHGGFRVLVNERLVTGRYRSSVAHELAHTLFYTNPEGDIPRRLISQSPPEEYFCFDVARHLLAPEQHLKAIGIFDEPNIALVFSKLTDTLFLSRPWAARVMLADYMLADGIAGRWIQAKGGWKQEIGSATATPSLSDQERRKLRTVAKNYLENPHAERPGYRILAVPEKSSDGVFVVVTIG